MVKWTKRDLKMDKPRVRYDKQSGKYYPPHRSHHPQELIDNLSAAAYFNVLLNKANPLLIK